MINNTNAKTHRGRRVLIAGGGIAGLSLARALKDAGHNPLVIERSREWPTTDTAHYLPVNALRALDQLGLGEAVTAAAHPISRQRVTGARGRTLVDLPVSSIWGNGGQSVAIRRNALHELLRRQLPGSPFAVEPASPPDFAMARSSSATDRSNNTTYWSVPTEPIPWYAPLASEARRHSTPVAGAGASLLMAGAARKTPGALA